MGKDIEKDETFYKVLSAAMELDVKKGHLKWTLSDLARKSGITRSLIYYYFGRSKNNILNEAVKMIGEEFTGNTEERLEMWKQGDLAKSMMLTRKLYETAPFIGPFFMEHRNRDTEIGAALKEVESSFIKKLKMFFPIANDAQIQALFVAFWGMAFAPVCTEEVVDIITTMMKKYFAEKAAQASS